MAVYSLADASLVKFLITQKQQKHKLLTGKLKTFDNSPSISYCFVVRVVKDVLETRCNTCTSSFGIVLQLLAENVTEALPTVLLFLVSLVLSHSKEFGTFLIA